MVLEGFSGRKIYLNDPATGPRVVTEQEFDESFTGIALAFEPSSGFRPRPGKGLWPSVRRRLRNSYAGIVYAALATLALAVPLFIVPVLSRVFIDSYLVERVAKWAQPLLVMMSVCAILIAALTYRNERRSSGWRRAWPSRGRVSSSGVRCGSRWSFRAPFRR